MKSQTEVSPQTVNQTCFDEGSEKQRGEELADELTNEFLLPPATPKKADSSLESGERSKLKT